MEKASLDLMVILKEELQQTVLDLQNLQILGPRNDYKTQKGRDAEFKLRGLIKRIENFQQTKEKQAQH
jgi:hypothetical protein